MAYNKLGPSASTELDPLDVLNNMLKKADEEDKILWPDASKEASIGSEDPLSSVSEDVSGLRQPTPRLEPMVDRKAKDALDDQEISDLSDRARQMRSLGLIGEGAQTIAQAFSSKPLGGQDFFKRWGESGTQELGARKKELEEARTKAVSAPYRDPDSSVSKLSRDLFSKVVGQTGQSYDISGMTAEQVMNIAPGLKSLIDDSTKLKQFEAKSAKDEQEAGSVRTALINSYGTIIGPDGVEVPAYRSTVSIDPKTGKPMTEQRNLLEEQIGPSWREVIQRADSTQLKDLDARVRYGLSEEAKERQSIRASTAEGRAAAAQDRAASAADRAVALARRQEQRQAHGETKDAQTRVTTFIAKDPTYLALRGIGPDKWNRMLSYTDNPTKSLPQFGLFVQSMKKMIGEGALTGWINRANSTSDEKILYGTIQQLMNTILKQTSGTAVSEPESVRFEKAFGISLDADQATIKAMIKEKMLELKNGVAANIDVLKADPETKRLYEGSKNMMKIEDYPDNEQKKVGKVRKAEEFE